MAFGLTNEGFNPKTTRDVLDGLETQERDQIDQNIDLSSEGPIGQLNGIFADRVAELWEGLAELYDATDPDNAEGTQLDSIALITGTKRQQPTKGTVTLTLTLLATTTVPAGSIVAQNANASNRWVLRDDVTSTTAGAYFGIFDAETAGEIDALAGTLTVIVTPVLGWTAVTNAADADPGLPLANDATLREAREQEIRASGNATPDAIASDLLRIDGVEIVRVLNNDQSITDSNGVPPHAIEAIVFDGETPAVANNAIAQAIWNTKAGGIEAAGSLLGTAIDKQGNAQFVAFSRAQIVDIEMSMQLLIDPLAYPDDGDDQVKAALVAFADANFRRMGVRLIRREFFAPVFSIEGVIDITLFTLAFDGGPHIANNLILTVRQLPRFSTAEITVGSGP